MKDEAKKSKRIKGNIFAWLFYTFCSRVFLFFKHHIKYNRKAFNKRNKKEGCLVIYNHMSNRDHFVTTASFKYTRVNYVITKYYYFNKTLRSVLNCVKAIPRDQFKSDLISIRKMKKVIDQKGIVAIAPAGQITSHGELIYIDPAIVKLVKFCRADLYALRMYGNYLAYPKWRRSKRNYPIETEFVKVLSKEEIASLSDDEIYKKVVDSINVSDYEYQRLHHYKVKGRGIIEGLETVTYYCPKCKSKHTFETNGNIMVCKKCGNKIRMNQFGFLEPASNDTVMFSSEYLWYEYEKELIKRQILDGSLHIEGNYKLLRNINDEFVLDEIGSGKVVLTSSAFYFEGTVNNEYYKKEFNLNQIYQLPFGIQKRFNVPDSEGTFEFRPIDNPNQIIEFVQAIDVMREIRTKEK